MYETGVQAAPVIGLTVAVAVVMMRMALKDGRVQLRSEHRCVSCGMLVQSRVCPRCGSASGEK
jgi:rRNA maturation endonuclease Nob1